MDKPKSYIEEIQRPHPYISILGFVPVLLKLKENKPLRST